MQKKVEAAYSSYANDKDLIAAGTVRACSQGWGGASRKPCQKRLVSALKLHYDELLSSFAFKFSLRRYSGGVSRGA